MTSNILLLKIPRIKSEIETFKYKQDNIPVIYYIVTNIDSHSVEHHNQHEPRHRK